MIHIRRSATTARADQHQYWLLFTFLFRFGLATTHNIIYPHKHIFCFSIFSVPYIHTHTSVGQASCGANNGFCLHGHARYCSIFLYGSRRWWWRRRHSLKRSLYQYRPYTHHHSWAQQGTARASPPHTAMIVFYGSVWHTYTKFMIHTHLNVKCGGKLKNCMRECPGPLKWHWANIVKWHYSELCEDLSVPNVWALGWQFSANIDGPSITDSPPVVRCSVAEMGGGKFDFLVWRRDKTRESWRHKFNIRGQEAVVDSGHKAP